MAPKTDIYSPVDSSTDNDFEMVYKYNFLKQFLLLLVFLRRVCTLGGCAAVTSAASGTQKKEEGKQKKIHTKHSDDVQRSNGKTGCQIPKTCK